MDNCIFCRIISGEIPSRTAYEDDDFKVILDASPATRGHSLILPKKHCADIFEIPDDTLSAAAKLAKKLAPRLKQNLGADGINIVQNNGEAAGQTVFHFHIHMIPRYKDPSKDDPKNLMWDHKEFSDDEYVEIVKALKD